jgi:formate hydrogenlyase subunit 6/NADH:ubiquinone oxidoreductase subunit I
MECVCMYVCVRACATFKMYTSPADRSNLKQKFRINFFTCFMEQIQVSIDTAYS